MNTLQLIDSLNAGGAERMAVALANGLASGGEVDRAEGSYLCATREEGLLKQSLNKNVSYLFLNKTSVFDLKAILKLRHFLKAESINVIHAHGTSFFTAVLVKTVLPETKLVWHNHYGNSRALSWRYKMVLKLSSLFFNHIVCVNNGLKLWSERLLWCPSVSVLGNYAEVDSVPLQTRLKGVKAKRIVCLANLRPDKDHLNLLKAFQLILKNHSDWTLHLVGKDFNDSYSKDIKTYISENHLNKNVFHYGSCPDTFAILKQATIGVLSSKSEGLPLALLEYGLAGLPVVATNVGDCDKVISNNKQGVLVPPHDREVLAHALNKLIENPILQTELGANLNAQIEQNFSKQSVLDELTRLYNLLTT